MKSDGYSWRIGEDPPILHVHSLAKHDILRAYLGRYVNVLAADVRSERLRLTLVDGFSGGGLYRHELTRKEISGSPLIFLEATREAEAEVRVRREQVGGKPFVLDAHYLFVERDPQTRDYLRHLLIERGYRDLLDNKIHLFDGTFAGRAAEMIQFIQNKRGVGRSIFLLDQYGYKDVPFGLLRQIFSTLPKAEVILTFAVDALCDYLGDNRQSVQLLQDMDLVGDIDLGDFAKTKGASDRRFFIQSKLSPVMQKQSGAKFFTPFFIVSRESNREYWLIHLSMHARARDEMTKLHWELHNYFRHNGGAGLNMFGYDPDKDDALTGQEAFKDFNFDDDARRRTSTQLRRDIPEVLIKYPDGITLDQLVRDTVNTTPAHTEFYQDTLDELLVEKDVVVQDADGSQRRKGHRIKGEDIIRIASQPTLFFRK